MAEDAPEQSSKSEDPTQKKLEDARKRGDVVKSQEVNTWFVLAASTLLLAMLAPWVGSGLTGTLRLFLASAEQYQPGGPAFGQLMGQLLMALAPIAFAPLLVLSIFAVAGNLVQHRPLLSVEPITPKLSKISPIDGFRRLFSTEALVNFVKGLVKLVVVSAVLVFVLWPERDRLDTMIAADPAVLMGICVELGLKILMATLVVVTVIAVADYLYQRQRWWNRLKMTVQETRDEYKQMEGDPKVKARIRQVRNERSRKRMMAAVPEATVIITNPTHYAVALQYEKSMAAPKCVAKGVDAVALRIRALAEEHDVPVVENPPLARALYASVDIDETIPADHFKAVAQVIGYVMRLRETRWRA